MGNDGNLVNEILKLNHVKLIGVVADDVSKAERKYFGSSFSISKELEIPVVSQESFNKNYEKYIKGIFKYVDIIFMQGYRYKIKKELLQDKKIKIINFHQSLLPKYGGRHPLNWAIIEDEKLTGITFHYINEDFDAGDIILQRKIKILKSDDIISLYNRTIKVASRLIGKILKLAYDKSFVSIKQDLAKRKYLAPRTLEDGKILKNEIIKQVRNKIRALAFPYPGAFVYLNGKKVIIDDVKRIGDSKKYGRIRFVGRYGSKIILRARDGLLKVTKTRKRRKVGE